MALYSQPSFKCQEQGNSSLSPMRVNNSLPHSFLTSQSVPTGCRQVQAPQQLWSCGSHSSLLGGEEASVSHIHIPSSWRPAPQPWTESVCGILVGRTGETSAGKTHAALMPKTQAAGAQCPGLASGISCLKLNGQGQADK